MRRQMTTDVTTSTSKEEVGKYTILQTADPLREACSRFVLADLISTDWCGVFSYYDMVNLAKA